MAISRRGYRAPDEGVWGLIQGRFRADPYKKYVAVSMNWRPFCGRSFREICAGAIWDLC